MWGKCLRWINNNKSKIIAAPTKRQSSNGLVERTWCNLFQMARTYLTEKHIPHEYWYWDILHGSRILNHVPGRLNRKLTSPFELVHGTKLDPRTWFKLFSLGFFHYQADGTITISKKQSHTMAVIEVRRCPSSNTITFYNPRTRSYYNPPTYRLEEARHPSSQFS